VVKYSALKALDSFPVKKRKEGGKKKEKKEVGREGNKQLYYFVLLALVL
jgi:hypothetical protein